MLKIRQIRDIIFYVGIFLMQFSIYAKNINVISNIYENLFNISIVILFMCSIITLIYMKTSKKNWIIFMILVIIAFSNYYITKDYVLVILITSIISAFNIEFKEIIKKDLAFKLILFFIILASYFTGNVEKVYFIRMGEIRYALGFNHPNSLGFYALMYYFEYIYYLKETNRLKKLKNFIFLIVINAILFYLMNLAHSRTSQICMIIYNLLLTFSYGLNKIRKHENNNGHIMKYMLIFSILTIASFYLTKQYSIGNTISIRINELLSNRLQIQAQFLNVYKIKLFGNYVEYFNTLDNSYIRMLLNYGIISWIIYGFIFIKMLYTAEKENNNILKINIITFMAYGLMEWYMVRPVINIFLLFFSSTLLKKKEIMKNEK